MVRDPRGGHNRKPIDEEFFKKWSPQMAYVLGLIFADGAIEDCRKSARTCYIQLASKDRCLLEKVCNTLSAKCKIYVHAPQIRNFFNGSYLCSKLFSFRIGNKVMFQDLINLGLTPRKPLNMKFPKIPKKYLSFFLRGYFDGDGCISVHKPKGRNTKRIRVILTSGSSKFLIKLSEILHQTINTGQNKVNKYSGAFRLMYSKRDSLKLLRFMYLSLKSSPYLVRKYKKFTCAFTNLHSRL